MYFVALATDYDGTIAEDGVVAEATLEALVINSAIKLAA